MHSRVAIFAAAILALVGSAPTASAVTATRSEGRAFVGTAPGLVPAAGVTGVRITAQQSGDIWTLPVSFRLNFTEFDANPGNKFSFTVWIELWEQDDVYDDFLVKTRPAKATPQTSGSSWNHTFKRTSDQLDQEQGGEEIYARVLVKNMDTGAKVEGASLRIQIAP
ncbi:hypothetical protein ACH4U5_31295 [Streptomyces sp. NPDC020858]|uniref:hypothetical protein n=1 Tax=Streptomyces sp. NPDC020858 TaxID=3365097 RepID=UPI0037945E58